MKDKNTLPIYKSKKTVKLSKKEEREYQKLKEELIQIKVNDENITVQDNEIKRLMDKQQIQSDNIIKKINNDLNGYGKIDILLQDDELEEIMIIGSNKPVYVYHRTKGMMITEILLTEPEIRQIITKIANFVQRKMVGIIRLQ